MTDRNLLRAQLLIEAADILNEKAESSKKTIDSVFGTLHYQHGWRCKTDIEFGGKTYSITVSAQAYAKDDITNEQQKAFSKFKNNEDQFLKKSEVLVNKWKASYGGGPFIPRTLYFKKDGGFALLFSDTDKNNDDYNDIAVILSPKQDVVLQNTYL